MARSFLIVFVTVALAAAAAPGYAFPERGSHPSKTAAANVTDVTVPETAEPETTAPAPASAPAAPAKSPRVKAPRDAGRERAVTAAREIEGPAPQAQSPASAASQALPAAPPPVEVPAPAPQPAVSTEVSRPAPSAAEVMPEGAGDFGMLRTLGGIGIVLTLMIGGFFAVRRFAPNLLQTPPVQKTLKIVETLQMGDKRSISIVQVGERRLLLGNTSSRITLLASLEGTAPGESFGIPAAQVAPKRAQVSGGNFRNVFELEKGPAAMPRGSGAPKTLAPDIRAKMRQLRESLEE